MSYVPNSICKKIYVPVLSAGHVSMSAYVRSGKAGSFSLVSPPLSPFPLPFILENTCNVIYCSCSKV